MNNNPPWPSSNHRKNLHDIKIEQSSSPNKGDLSRMAIHGFYNLTSSNNSDPLPLPPVVVSSSSQPPSTLPTQANPITQLVTQVNEKKRGLKDMYDKEREELIPKQGIRKLARKAGVKRMSKDVIQPARELLRKYVEQVIQDSLVYTEHARRKTMTAMDIVHALKRRKTTLYGFGNEYKA